MYPTYEVDLRLSDGSEVLGQVMYLIVWEGKSLSGGEVLVRGEDIESMNITKISPTNTKDQR